MLALSRRKGTYWARVVMGVVAISVMVYLLFLSYSQISFAQQGKSVFVILSSLSFGYALLAGIVATSDCVSEEKREGTLGLLFLTDLKGYDIVFGKLAASSLNAALALLAVVPVLAIAMMLGGVLLQEVGLVTLILANTLFVSLAAGVLVSSYCQNERRAMLGCIVVLLLLVAGPYLGALALNQFEHVPEEFVWMSPLYSFLCIQVPGGMLDTSYFWRSLLWQHCIGWFLLAWASRKLPTCINDIPRLKFQRIQRAFHQWAFGTEQKRLKHRRQLLDRNAFMWLASRERVKKQYAWSMLVFFGALYYWIYWQYPQMGLDLPVAGVILFLTHLLFKLWQASEVCSRLIEDKRSGALELLLTSPMTIRDMARGQQMALRRIFGAPIAVLIMAEIWLFLLTYRWRDKNDVLVFYGAAVSTLLLDLWALKWVGLWNSVFGKSIEKVLVSTLVRVLGLPWIIFAVLAGTGAALANVVAYNITEVQLLTLWWIIGILVSVIAGASARASFLAHFRDAASHRFDARPINQSSLSLWVGDTFGRFAVVARVWRKVPSPLRKHPILSSFALMFVLVFSGMYGRQIYWQTKANKRIEIIRQKSEPTRMAELPKFIPPVPANENGLSKLEEAGAVSWFGLNMANTSFDKNLGIPEEETIKKALSINAVPLAAARSLTNYQKGYRLMDGNAGWGNVNTLYGYPQLLRMDLRVAFANRAWEGIGPERDRIEVDMKAALALARLTRQVPYDDAQSVCLASLETFKMSLEHAFQLMHFPAADLERWKREIEAIEQIDIFQKKVIVMRTMVLEQWHGMTVPNMPSQPFVFAAVGGVAKSIGVTDRLTCAALDRFDDLLNEDFSKCVEKYGTLPVHPGPRPGAGFLEQAFSGIVNLEGAIRAELQVIKTAIAIEEYRSRQRRLPSELADLVPGYLKALPKDPFGGGAPLLFKRENDKLLLYSVSANRQDDKGQNLGWYMSGDIAFKFSE